MALFMNPLYYNLYIILPGWAGWQSSTCPMADRIADTTALPPWTWSSQTSSPVKLRGSKTRKKLHKYT